MIASLLIPPSFGLSHPLRNRVFIEMDLLLPPNCSGNGEWHASQVQLVGGATTAQKVAQEVSVRIFGSQREDENWKWERSRKELITR